MIERRRAVAAWSGAVFAASIAVATLIGTLDKVPAKNSLFHPSIYVAIGSFVILIASGAPDLYAWMLDGIRPLGKIVRRQVSGRATFDRWQYTTDGLRAPALARAMEMSLAGISSLRSFPDRKPWVKFAMLIACNP